jgi:pilus assembly protein CpaB
MELANKSPLRSGLSTRSGALVAAAIAAIIAAVLVFAAINAARKDSGVAGSAARVLVANQLIPKGSTAQALSEQSLFRVARVGEGALVAGAVTDLSQIKGKVATVDIYPGQQLSTGAFTAGSGALTNKLSGSDRAVALSLDSQHGLVGNISAGDRVDVIVGFNVEGRTSGVRAVTRLLTSNVLVLKADKKNGTSGGNSDVTVRVPADMAAKLTFSADNGKVWLVLRPGAGAKETAPRLVTANSILFGVKPVQVEGQ